MEEKPRWREEKPRKEMEKVGGDSLLGRVFLGEISVMSLESLGKSGEDEAGLRHCVAHGALFVCK